MQRRHPTLILTSPTGRRIFTLWVCGNDDGNHRGMIDVFLNDCVIWSSVGDHPPPPLAYLPDP